MVEIKTGNHYQHLPIGISMSCLLPW